MIQKEWHPDRIKDQLLLQAIRNRRPLSCTLEVTYQCNFRCGMCYVRMSSEQAAPYGRLRTLEEWLGLAQQLLDAGVLYLNLTGGECTRYPGFVPLYEALCRMGFLVSIMSNAGAWTDAVRDVFRRFPPQSVGITLYGASNETCAAVTGDPNGLDRALGNIRFLQSLGVPTTLNFTVVRQNVLDYPKVDRLCRELQLPYTVITDLTTHQRDPAFSKAAEWRLSPAEQAVVACCKPDEVAQALQEAPALEAELRDFRMPEAPAEPLPPELDACIGSVTSCAIYWNGEMNTCVSTNGCQNVRPFEIGFEAAWQQLKARFETTFHRPAVCQACSMAPDCLHNCAGRRFEGTGSTQEPDPYTCQYVYLLRICKSRQPHADPPPSPMCV